MSAVLISVFSFNLSATWLGMFVIEVPVYTYVLYVMRYSVDANGVVSVVSNKILF